MARSPVKDAARPAARRTPLPAATHQQAGQPGTPAPVRARTRDRAYTSKDLLRAHFSTHSDVQRKAIYVRLFYTDPLERVDLVKNGIEATAVYQLAKDMDLPKERMASTLGLSRATVDRKASGDAMLSKDDSSRVLGMIRLLGQVQAMVEESGNPDGFEASRWVSTWLQQPSPALGGRAPSELMDTSEGQGIVSGLVAQMQSGAYA